MNAGETFAAYTLTRPLGTGTFGETWLADVGPNATAAPAIAAGAPVVVKIGAQPRDASFAREQAALRATMRALQGARGVRPLLDAGSLPDGRPYLVYPWIEGQTLDRVLARSGRLPVAGALDIAAAIAAGLAPLHASGVLHRDIKPSNVLLPSDVARNGVAVLLDLGLAGEIRESTGTTLAGQLFGTPLYMSPEQMRGLPQTPAADIYGLGVVLYEMVYGRKPFDADNLMELAAKVLTLPVSFDATTGVPETVRAFVARCLAKAADERPKNGADAMATLDALRAALAMDARVAPPRAAAPGAPPRAPSPAPAGIGAPPPPSPYGPPPPGGFGAPPAQVSVGAPAQFEEVAHPTAATGAFPRGEPRRAAPVLLTAMVLATAAIALALGARGPRWISAVAGGALAVAGALASYGVTIVLKARKSALAVRSEALQGRAMTRAQLSESIAIDLAQLIAQCHGTDERILGHSIALWMNEYNGATSFAERKEALSKVTEVLDKLTARLSPWYVRNEKLLPTLVGIVGLVGGVVTTVLSWMGKK